MNVVVTRSPFEAARSEVDISEVIWAEIIYINKLDYIECKSITTKNTDFSNWMPMEFYTTCRFTKVSLFVSLSVVILRHP